MVLPVLDELKGSAMAQANNRDPRWMSVDELQERLSISRSQAYKLATNGTFETLRIGRSLRINEESFLHWCESQRCKSL